MKTFEQLTIKQVKKEILYREQHNENPKSIEVVCVGQEPDSDPYVQGDGSTCEHFFAVVLIDGVKHCMGYEWDCDDEDITASWDDDEMIFIGADSNNDNELLENILERCKCVPMTMDSTDMTHCNVNPAEKLKVPVDIVRWNYPFVVESGGDYNVYHIEQAYTWGELLTRIVEVFRREYGKHEKELGHVLGDYIIELLEIHPNGLATVHFGS